MFNQQPMQLMENCPNSQPNFALFFQKKRSIKRMHLTGERYCFYVKKKKFPKFTKPTVYYSYFYSSFSLLSSPRNLVS